MAFVPVIVRPGASPAVAGGEPTKISVTNGAIVTLLAASETRLGFYIIHLGATVYWGFNNRGGVLATFQANAMPLLATQPLTQQDLGVYRGPIYAVCQAGEGPVDVFVTSW